MYLDKAQVFITELRNQVEADQHPNARGSEQSPLELLRELDNADKMRGVSTKPLSHAAGTVHSVLPLAVQSSASTSRSLSDNTRGAPADVFAAECPERAAGARDIASLDAQSGLSASPFSNEVHASRLAELLASLTSEATARRVSARLQAQKSGKSAPEGAALFRCTITFG
jgi:hypothetical protein